MFLEPMRIIILFLALGFTVAQGQTLHRGKTEVQYGFIIPHAADLKPVSGYNPVGILVNWQLMKTDRNSWEACNCFHYLGLQFSYTWFGNREILGSAYTLAGTFEPVLWQQRRWSLSLQSGLGVSYLTRYYNSETNPLNNFFSSPISFWLFVAPALEYRLLDRWGLRASLNYNHISNGGQKQPNRGMNFPQAGLGFNYYLQPQTEMPYYEKRLPDKTWHQQLEGGFTTRKTGNGHEREPEISLAASVYRPLNSINAAGGGMEFINNWAVSEPFIELTGFTIAPFISHHFLLGRFDFNQRMGFYLHRTESVNFRLYQRYALYYKLKSHLKLGFSLKAHGHRAENIDVRVGWEW
jgi:hypothetical protein